MAVWARLLVEGQADTDVELQAAVAYLGEHGDIVEFSFNEVDRTVFASTPYFPWAPLVPDAEATVADPTPPVEEEPTTEPPAE